MSPFMSAIASAKERCYKAVSMFQMISGGV